MARGPLFRSPSPSKFAALDDLDDLDDLDELDDFQHSADCEPAYYAKSEDYYDHVTLLN